MLLLTGTSRLITLQKALTHSLPDSMKVCGTLCNMIPKNPFRLQVLVDRWPDFTSVVCRPPLEEMTEPLNAYYDAYFMFSKNPQSLSQMLHDPRVINWNKDVHIEVCQPALGEMLQMTGSKHGRQMQTFRYHLCTRGGMDSEELEKISNVTSTGDLIYTPLLSQDAAFVNDKWKMGMNERTLKYVQLSIENFPSICVRRKELDPPVAWLLTDNAAEITLGYTDPAYRNLGIGHTMVLKLAAANYKRGIPIYAAVKADNKKTLAMERATKFKIAGELLLLSSFKHKGVPATY